MKTYATALQKGGVGKTTMAVSIAAELAKNKKVILIDCDPQGNASGSILKNCNCELADYLNEKKTLDEVIHKTEIENLFMIPTLSLNEESSDLSELREYRQTKAAKNPNSFKFLISDLAEKGFDYCIIDTSPNFDVFEQNIYFACDEILAIITLDIFASDGLTIFTENLANFKKRNRLQTPVLQKVILNAYDKRIAFHKQLLEKLSEREDLSCFTVPVDQAFKRSQNSQVCIQKVKSVYPDTLESLKVIASYL